jgi:hypothetical protein
MAAATAGMLLLSMVVGAVSPVTAQNSDNPNCTLIVPEHPLTAEGLATPYLLTNADDGPCHEANPAQSAFMQAAVVNPDKGVLSIYEPLVIDKGTEPAAAPVVPKVPKGSVVGIWFGFNGDVLTLEGAHKNTLRNNNCVNGLPGSPFGQFAYCNAVDFFAAANEGIDAGTFVPPPLGTDRKGLTCPTTRDFFLIDQDQSDNLTTQYLVTPDGRIAQDTTANRRSLPEFTVLSNPSDSALLLTVNPALGCPSPWKRPNLTDPGTRTTALPLEELQAAARQPAPMALIPANDPMVLVMRDGELAFSLRKVNLYRAGVDQPLADSLQDASPRAYCRNYQQIAPPRLATDARLLGRAATPDAAVGNTLFTFMAQRYVNSFTNPLGEGLNCKNGFDLNPRVATRQNGDGVAVAVLITVNGEKQCFNSRGIEAPRRVCKGDDDD